MDFYLALMQKYSSVGTCSLNGGQCESIKRGRDTPFTTHIYTQRDHFPVAASNGMEWMLGEYLSCYCHNGRSVASISQSSKAWRLILTSFSQKSNLSYLHCPNLNLEMYGIYVNMKKTHSILAWQCYLNSQIQKVGHPWYMKYLMVALTTDLEYIGMHT